MRIFEEKVTDFFFLEDIKAMSMWGSILEDSEHCLDLQPPSTLNSLLSPGQRPRTLQVTLLLLLRVVIEPPSLKTSKKGVCLEISDFFEF